MEISDIERFNSWWKTGKVRAELLEAYKRKLFSQVRPFLGRRQMMLIWGLRRTGKTVLLLQLIQHLLDEARQDPKRILFFSFDEAAFDVKDVIETYQKAVLNKNFDEVDGSVYLFLDEVQKVKDWQNKLKTYYDLYPNLRFVLSGSASARLKKNSTESLAGRMYDFQMRPLSFEEFLELSGKDMGKIRNNINLWRREIVPLFYKYLKFGMFPELVREESDEIARRYIINNVVERIIYKDIPEEFEIKDLELLKSLAYLVEKNPGMLLNYSEISRNLGRDKRTVSNYFEYLELGLLIKFSFNYRGSSLASMRKLKKAYLATPNIAFAYSESLEQVLPKALENLIMVATDSHFFYRNGFEIDFIIQEKGGIKAIEVKKSANEVKQIRKFKKKFSGKVRGSVIVDMEKEGVMGGIKVVPAWKFILEQDTKTHTSGGGTSELGAFPKLKPFNRKKHDRFD